MFIELRRIFKTREERDQAYLLVAAALSLASLLLSLAML